MRLFDQNKPFDFVHVELTEKCNAACPMCMRNKMVKQGKLGKGEMSLEEFKTIFGPIVTDIKEFWLSGNYSDPMMNSQIYEICEWIFETSPNTTVRINTNCSMRTPQYWQKLGQLFSKYKRSNSGIVASIDGLKDTNHLYRVNCDFDKIIENCKAFIDAGGYAMWKFIVFDYNEHQIEEARKMATDLKFAMFSTVASARFNSKQQKVIFQDRKGRIKEVSQPTTAYKIEDLLEQEHDTIDCQAVRRNEIFVDDKGRVMPCCWLMGRVVEHGNIGNDKSSQVVWKRYPNILDDLNALKHGIQKVLGHKFWDELEMLWDINSPGTCVSKCKKRIDDVAHYHIDGEEVGWRKM